MRKLLIALYLILILNFLYAADNKIIIFHAGSLSIPFKQMKEAFMKKYHQYEVLTESSGSVDAVRKISELNKRCEIIASADYTVIDKILIPKFANWNLKFVVNEMVIMYSSNSKYSKEINSKNWYDILLRKDVQYGHSDPNADPAGYRSLMTWQLAEKFYKKTGLFDNLDKNCPPKNIRSKEVDMLGLLEAGELDYLFIYRSVAEQHKAPFIILPDEINLKLENNSSFYKNAEVKIKGATPDTFITQKGEPMIYSFTIPNTAENTEGAILFAKFILSPEGRDIMIRNGQPFMNPPTATGDLSKLPLDIKSLMK